MARELCVVLGCIPTLSERKNRNSLHVSPKKPDLTVSGQSLEGPLLGSILKFIVMLCAGPPKLCPSCGGIWTAFSCSDIIVPESRKEALVPREEREAFWREKSVWGSSRGLCATSTSEGETDVLCSVIFKTLAVLALCQTNQYFVDHSVEPGYW